MVVNPFREPGLERYWVPSVARSARLRHRAHGRLLPGDDRRRPRLPERRAEGAARARRRSTATSSPRTRPASPSSRAALAAQDWELLERESGLAARRDGALRRALRRGAERRLRLEHGRHPAPLRRRERRRDRQSRARARHARPAAVRPHADPRPQRRPGRGRVRRRAERAAGRRADRRRGGARPLRGGLGIPACRRRPG